MAERQAQKSSSKRGSTRRSGTQLKERTRQQATAELTPQQAVELAESFTEVVDQLQRAAAATAPAVGDIGPLGLGETAADSNVTDELSGGGVAFGEFVKSVGLAVADAQSALDKTMVDSAKALSETQIDTVAVFEQVIKDADGTMDTGIVHTQKLPLTNYVMPTVYQWSRVYLQADMNVQEFNSRNGFNIQQKSMSLGTSIGANAGTFGWGASGSAHFGMTSASTGVDAATSSDLAAGKLHMEATLEPRADVQLPRPFVIQKGPRLQLQVGSRQDVMDPNDATKKIGVKVTLTAVLSLTNGSAAPSGTSLSISISDPTLNYTSSGQTDANGKMTIDVSRTGASYDPTTPVQAAVRVSFGLVSQSVAISM